MKMGRYFTAVVVSLLIVGCTLSEKNISPFPSIDEDAKASLKARVNCQTADRDIAVLEEEHASVGRRIAAGARSVFPIAVVAGILTNDYNDRFEVASGQYNEDIEKKIAEIKDTCHLK